MKALIVDDEAAAVIAVKLLVNWEKCGIDTVYEVNASEDVMPLIRSEEIQIVISDIKMPGLSGLDLIAEIHRIRPNTKIIMMSGFGQFDYVRAALQKGCIDYILKPIDEQQINAAVERALEEWKKDVTQQAIEHSYQKINSQMEKRRAQKDLLLGISSQNMPRTIQKIAAALPAFGSLQSWRIAQIQTSHLPEEALIGENDVSILSDMVNDLAWSTGRAIAITQRVNSNIMILFDATIDNAHDFLYQILSILHQKTGIAFVMGVSDAHPLTDRLPLGLDEAKERAKRFRFPVEGVGALQESAIPASETDSVFGKFEDALHKVCLSGMESAILRCAEECAASIALQPLCIDLLEKVHNEYLSMRIRWIEGFRLSRKNAGKRLRPPDPVFRLPFTAQGAFSEQLLANSLGEDLTALAGFFQETLGKKENDGMLFQQVEQYILLSYVDKITLGSIAEKFCVSEGYLSRAFKKNIGMGITDYINGLRVNKAKELLHNSQLRIADIAFQVGFTDEKYFSRVFHKYENMSPQQYRTQRE